MDTAAKMEAGIKKGSSTPTVDLLKLGRMYPYKLISSKMRFNSSMMVKVRVLHLKELDYVINLSGSSYV